MPVAARDKRRRALLEQVRLTDHTYCSYLAHSRYPHTSRPAGHHPDQLYPNRPVVETVALRGEDGRADASIRVQTSQSRVYLAAGESVEFALGAAAPLVVTRALAQGMTYGTARPAPRVTLAFADDGAGTWRAAFTPGQGALADFHGTIRVEVRYTTGGRAGVVLFDVIHSPTLPATWAGPPREAIGPEAVDFTLPLDVRLAGRYVVSGRVDDARGRPFALATFNAVLGAGMQNVVLSVHGKLLHDGAPALPLMLRDVEGFLLREDLDPDRLLLPRREGVVLTSSLRTADGVPDLEWMSEERSRYLREYANDRLAARARLAQADRQAALPALDCAPDQ